MDESGPVIRIEHEIRKNEVSGGSPLAYTVTIKNELIGKNDLVVMFECKESRKATGLTPIRDELGYRHMLIADGMIRYDLGSPAWSEISTQRINPAGSKVVIFIVKPTQSIND